MKKMYRNKLSKIWSSAIIYRNYCYKLNEKRVADFPSRYVSKGIEQYWNEIWEKHKYFCTNETKVEFKMILPPPNVTGFLHLGHALTVTIQDVLARWHRMKGDTVLWVPGLDHAGIATQAAVEKYLLATKNVTRHDLGREQFLNHIEQWKIEKSSKINNQLKTLGASLDWSKEYFTMSKAHNNAVTEALIILNERNLLYRKCDLVNWCPSLRSTISDIEVEFLKIDTKTDLQVPGYNKKIRFGEMVDIAYRLKDSQDELIVSTTRVESMYGDVAIAVHPDDSRYSHYIGKQVWHPLREIFIPVIHDLAVKPDFGTGVMKITPAHDHLDFEIAQRNNLKFINVIDEDGKMTTNSKEYAGQRRFEARKNILNHLSNLGALKQIKDHPMSIPICSRTGDIIEYLIKEQWFLKTKNMAERALNAVKNKQMKIEPKEYETLWFDKLNNIHDWCISRQLWWGHRIPAYNCTINNEKHWIIARNNDHAQELIENKYGNNVSNIEQDNDVLDTWFSAALLPITAMGWPDMKYSNCYPLDLMETGHDILFYWVARMAMLSTELTGIIPFKEILLHGIICDAQGKKMSKSRGNVILPEYIIDGISRNDLNAKAQENFSNGILSKTELKRTCDANNKMFPEGIYECGVDALRLTLCSHNIKNDRINFNVIECRTNNFFCNKIWQACRYVLLITDDDYIETPEVLPTIDRWILSRLTMMVENVNEHFEQRNFYKAIAAIKKFFYHEFCDFYIEATKPTLEIGNNDMLQCHRYTLIKCLDISLRIIAPIMPYLSEQLYSRLAKKLPNFQNVPSIMATSFPITNDIAYRDCELEIKFNEIIKVVLTMRNILSHINKKSICEVHIVLNESKNMDIYLQNINLIIATTKIKNIKIFSMDNYVIQDKSVCTNEADCKLYYLLTDNDIKEQIKININNKRLQIEQKLEKLLKKSGVSKEEDNLKIEKQRNDLEQELQKYPEFI